MRLNSFDLNEPVPELNQPHALAIIRPWTDVSGVGSLVLSFGGLPWRQRIGTINATRGFFRLYTIPPHTFRKENSSEVIVPNTTVTYGITHGTQPGSHDFMFLRLLEPHMQAEAYVDSVIELFKNLGVKRYCLLGSMFDMVPYTRPLLVTGNASNPELQNELALVNVRHSDYQGTTSILSLIGNRAIQLGIETCSMIVHLPNYLTMEEDYRGEKRLME
jgi:hypothetical protein